MNIHTEEESIWHNPELSGSEKSFSIENPLFASSSVDSQKGALSQTTDRVIGLDSDITHEHIPLFENSHGSGIEEMARILFTPAGSPVPGKNRIKSYTNSNESSTPGLELSTTIDPDVQELLVEIFEIYTCTHEFLLELESQSRYEVTDILQHEDILDYITYVLTEHSGTTESQLRTLNLVKNHVERVPIEAITIFVQETDHFASEYLGKPSLYYTLTFSPLPDKNRIRKYLKKTKRHLRMGRQLKDTDGEYCLREFNKAYVGALSLRNVLPDRNEVRYRFFVILISLTSAAVAVTSTCLYPAGRRPYAFTRDILKGCIPF
jgi:hypothetical protein